MLKIDCLMREERGEESIRVEQYPFWRSDVDVGYFSHRNYRTGSNLQRRPEVAHVIRRRCQKGSI